MLLSHSELVFRIMVVGGNFIIHQFSHFVRPKHQRKEFFSRGHEPTISLFFFEPQTPSQQLMESRPGNRWSILRVGICDACGAVSRYVVCDPSLACRHLLMIYIWTMCFEKKHSDIVVDRYLLLSIRRNANRKTTTTMTTTRMTSVESKASGHHNIYTHFCVTIKHS